jgi:glycosyltransferase involved in cell wall biosynthesis
MISGAALAVQNLAEAMAQRGHQVLVIAASDRAKPYQTVKDNLTIVRLNSIHNPLRANQRFLLHPQPAIIKALHKFQPDIIHAHEPLQTAWAGIAYARRTHTPITLTIHQLPWFVASYLPNLPALRRHAESLLWTYARGLLQGFTSVITPTRTVSGLLTSVTGIKTVTISNGIDLQRFHPPLSSDVGTATRQKLNLPPNIPILLHVGRLDTDKHADRVITAAAHTMQNTAAHLLIVGDGCEKRSLVHLSHALGIAHRVHFADMITDRQFLSDIYGIANVFITASEIETQGVVLLEAAASGLPIVAVNATCIPEIVHDQVNGFLVNPGDTTAMSNRTITLLNDPQIACTMGRVGRLLAEKHGMQHTWSLHEKLYQGLVRKSRLQRARSMIEKENWLNPWKAMKAWIGFK